MGAAAIILIAFALMIPLTAIVLDSPVVRAWVERMHGAPLEGGADVRELSKKVGILEADLETVTRQLAQLQEEHQFMQRLLEDPAHRAAAQKSLPKSGS
ncbi:MAG: hypothetical protein ABR998_11250 [Gemmatimonadales bacterium]|jgi:glutathione S-transferase